MTRRETPAPFPTQLRDDVEWQMRDKQMSMLDNNARFIVRRMISDAYALGFQDGRFDNDSARRTDEMVAKDAADKAKAESEQAQ